MTRLPRDLSGEDLIRKLRSLGYEVLRTVGSHARLGCDVDGGTHRLTAPLHSSLRVGTLNQILKDVASRHGLTKGELAERLFA